MASLRFSFFFVPSLQYSLTIDLLITKQGVSFLVSSKVIEHPLTFDELNFLAYFSFLFSCQVQIFPNVGINWPLGSIEELEVAVDIFKISVWQLQRGPIYQVSIESTFELDAHLDLVDCGWLQVVQSESFHQVVIDVLLKDK